MIRLRGTSALSLIVLIAASVVFPAAGPARAQEADTAFAKATDAYRTARYREAVGHYESIVANGWESATLYYNLGNAYYKLGEMSAAILSYERALRMAPGDPDIAHNLAMANLRIVDRIDPLPRLFFVDWWYAFLALLSPDDWGTAAVLALWIASAAGVLMLSSPRFRTQARLLCGLTLAAAVVGFSAGHFQNEELHAQSRAVVFGQSVTVKSAPDSRSTDLFVIHEGLRVDVLDSVSEWVNIRLADGKSGWMRKDELQMI